MIILLIISILLLFWAIKPILQSQSKDIDFMHLPTFNSNFPINECSVKVINNMAEEKQEITAILKEPKFNSDKIIEYQGEEYNQFEFRPQNFTQFIGQEEAKERAKTIVAQAHRGIKSHFILSALQGHGKSTYVELLAKELDAKLLQYVGKQIDEDSLLDIINQINLSTEKYVILFIDETDSMDWKVIKILNPIIEQFKINGKKIKPFIFAGATINYHVLVKNNPDTLDRIPHKIKFKRYTQKDISKIIIQYINQLYKDENIPQEVINIISKSSKYNPRTAISLLEEYIVVKNINKVMKNRRIIKDGLNEIDIKILKVLNNSKKAMGANALALRCGLSEKEYSREIEPFLFEFGYINRIPSRIISEKGKQLLGKINDK